MLNISLNIIAIIVIISSLFFINKISQQEKNIYDEIKLIYNDIKEYSLAIENTLDSFYELVQINLNNIENLDDNNKTVETDDKPTEKTEKQPDEMFLEDDKEIGNADQILYNEIRSLKKIGLNNE